MLRRPINQSINQSINQNAVIKALRVPSESQGHDTLGRVYTITVHTTQCQTV